MLRTVVSRSLLATTARFGAIDSSAAWPLPCELRTADDLLIVPVQMRGAGMGDGGMAGGTAITAGMAANDTAASGTVGQGSRGSAAVAATKGGGAVKVNAHGTSIRTRVQRPYFGTAIGGIALGSVIAAPAPPADNLCWVWTSAKHTHWDYYCTPP